jgi:hypothetical protein
LLAKLAAPLAVQDPLTFQKPFKKWVRFGGGECFVTVKK